jgi:alpha-tubulin suppressor-like RCC1 family protein
VGPKHACAVDRAGRVHCWGKNDYGLLGDGTAEDRASPAEVLRLENARSISVSDVQSCAALSDGSVWCWGKPDFYWSHARRLEPLRVDSVHGAVDVGAGHTFACALMDRGAVACWRYAGESGVSITPGSPRARQIAVHGMQACALLHGGSVACWTTNDLASGGRTFVWKEVAGFHGFSKIALGGGTLCGVAVSGTLRCARAPGASEPALDPPRDFPSGGITELALGEHHGCAITEESKLYCWGESPYGETGRADRQAGATEVVLPR